MTQNDFFHWLAGFTAGEGCFYIHKTTRNKVQGNRAHIVTYRPRFQIKLRDDDSAILETIASELGFGRFSKIQSHGRSKPCRTFEVYKLDDMVKLIPIFDLYPLRNKKQADYLIWREAVMYIKDSPRGNKHCGSRDWSKLKQYKEQLELTRAYRATS